MLDLSNYEVVNRTVKGLDDRQRRRSRKEQAVEAEGMWYGPERSDGVRKTIRKETTDG